MPQTNEPSAKWVDITPDMAREWLGHNTDNRNKRGMKIAAYVRDITAGSWQLTGETIKFDWDGALIDGQHRLEAIARSGVTVRTLVVLGLDPAVKSVIDAGATRSARDALKFNGIDRYQSTIAAMARIDIAWTTGHLNTSTAVLSGSTLLTNSEVVKWAEKHGEEALECAALAGPHAKKIYATAAPMAYAVMLTMRRDPVAADRFWSDLINLDWGVQGDPKKALVKALRNVHDSGIRKSEGSQLYLMFRAWNANQKHERVTALPLYRRRSNIENGVQAVGFDIPEPR